jgi:hypothetical protein
MAGQAIDDDSYVTVSPDEGEPVPTKHAKPTRGEATTEDGQRQDVEPRSETGRRVRKIVGRQRETFDELAK